MCRIVEGKVEEKAKGGEGGCHNGLTFSSLALLRSLVVLCIRCQVVSGVTLGGLRSTC